MNHFIQASQLRVIDEDGQPLGVMSKSDALKVAEERDLDLVEVSSTSNPPVAKIVNWGKFNYQRTKQLQKNRRGAKTPELKQMRFGLKISEHDLGVKLKKVISFLSQGHKVKMVIVYRGREQAHKDVGFQLAERVINSFNETIAVDQPPQLAGRQLSFVIRSNSNAKTQNP